MSKGMFLLVQTKEKFDPENLQIVEVVGVALSLYDAMSYKNECPYDIHDFLGAIPVRAIVSPDEHLNPVELVTKFASSAGLETSVSSQEDCSVVKAMGTCWGEPVERLNCTIVLN
jgi:hypothetical protein